MTDIIRVLSVDLPPDEARHFAADPDALERALGIAVPADRVQLIDPATLAGIGLANYLIEGEGARAAAVAADRDRLEAVGTPVLLLLSGAIPGTRRPEPVAPLTLVGEYPLEDARGADGPIHTKSAERLAPGTPPPAGDPSADRRVGGYVAIAALTVALLVALIVWLVAI